MLTAERLREVLDYDAETGIFLRIQLNKHCRKELLGNPAGTINGEGYIQIKVDDRTYLAHRLAWLYVKGKWPDRKLDHENRRKVDNRFRNLREASGVQNSRNRDKPRNNTSGFKGVSWISRYGHWQATIKFNGRNKNLGRFSTAEAAAQAYDNAAEKYHGNFAKLNRRSLKMMKLSFAGATIAEINGSILAYAATLAGEPAAAGKPSAPVNSATPGTPASPAGTTSSSADTGSSAGTSTSGSAPPTASPSSGSEVDAAGVPWDAAKHAGTKAKVASGLWRMKVGVKRAEGEGEDSPSYVKPGASAPASAAPNATPAPPAPPAAPIDPNRPSDPAWRHDNGDGTEQWYVGDAWDGGKHAIPSAAIDFASAAFDPDDEFAQFATAAAAPAMVGARSWSDADLGKLCNQAATAVGAANVHKVKDIIAKYIPAGEPVQHSRNIPADEREVFARDVEASLGITYGG